MNCENLARVSCVALGLSVVFVPARISAKNPNGFIQSNQWACLVPLAGNDCLGGGPRAMLGNWVAPHDVTAESPVVGTVWNDIDIGGAARSVAWLGSGAPTFVNIGPGSVPDQVDYAEYLSGRELPEDFVLAIAVTYVENTTGVPLRVGVCTASSDSMQVWLDNALVLNQSVRRRLTCNCTEVTPAVLAPGVHRITTLVWNGRAGLSWDTPGGFGFRLGLTNLTEPDGRKFTDQDGEIRFLGASQSVQVSPPLPILTRVQDGSREFRPSQTHSIALSGDESFEDERIYRVIEEIQRQGLRPQDVGEVSHDGAVAELFPPPPPPPAPVGVFDDERVVGMRGVIIGSDLRVLGDLPVGVFNTTTLQGDEYVSISSTGAVLWSDGDFFEFAYSLIEGDFDISVCFTSREHSTSAGRWGKFGLMARWSLAENSRFTMIQDHLPDLQDRARLAGRTTHDVGPPTGGMFEDVAPPELAPHPLCFRLSRAGNLVRAWASDDPGLADGTLDPRADVNWRPVGRTDDWGASAPLRAYVGFANSEHRSGGSASPCVQSDVQTVRFRLLRFWGKRVALGDRGASDSTGVKVTWEVPGSILKGRGLSYSVSSPRGSVCVLWGSAVDAVILGPDRLYFQNPGTGPLGVFDDAHDIGVGGPCTPGSLTVDEGGTPEPEDDLYTMTASGEDIWADADQLHVAYRELSGDFSLQARFASVVPPRAGGRWGKFGLMARWDCRPNAPYFFTHNSAATNATCEIDGPRGAFRRVGGVNDWSRDVGQLWWQDVFGAEGIDPGCRLPNPDNRVNDIRGDERNRAPWLRLVRRGNTFYGYASDDAEDWRILGSYTWPDAPERTLAGVAMTSHAGCDVQQVSFDNVSFGTPDVPRLVTAPGAGPDDLEGEVLMRFDFDGDENRSCPRDWSCNRWRGRGGFRPQVLNGRLRLGTESNDTVLGSGIATQATAFSTEPIDPDGAYLFDFDVLFSYDEVAAAPPRGPLPPADGITFCVLGTDDLLRRPPALPQTAGEFSWRTVGCPCGVENETLLAGDVYTTRAITGRDLGANGDTFSYAYKVVQGDFDLAVEITARRFPDSGRRGKFGLMARQSLDVHAKYGAVEDHGPLDPQNDDPAGYARRVSHKVIDSVEEPATTEGLLDPNDGSELVHPRSVRLTRRAGVVGGWVSNTAGSDSGNDDNWRLVFEDDWANFPAAVYAGFFYSAHFSSGCTTGEIDWKLLHFTGNEVPESDVPAGGEVPFGLDFRLGVAGGDLAYHTINQSLSECAVRSRDISLNSFALEFDNWNGGVDKNEGSGTRWDPDGGATGTGTGPYHIGINVNATTYTAQRNHELGVHDSELPDIYHPAGIHARVLYDHGLVRAWVRSNAVSTEGWLKVVDYEIEPVAFNAPRALVGFTASTGLSTCIMEVDNFVVRRALSTAPFHGGGPTDDVVITDPISIFNYVFLGGAEPPCLHAAGVDNARDLATTDGIRLLRFFFLEGLPPLPAGSVREPSPGFSPGFEARRRGSR